MKKQRQLPLPEGVILKKIMLTDANGIEDGRHVFVMARPEPEPTNTPSHTNTNTMNIEQLNDLLLHYRRLAEGKLSVQQMERLIELVAETHKKIEALSPPPIRSASANVPPIHPEHGPHAFNRIGYKKYVCDTNPSGFCLSVQNHIATLIWNIRNDTTRKAGMGLRDDGVSADVMCGVYHINNEMNMYEIVKSAVCLDKDMWRFFRVRPIKGESKHLTKFRQELFCLTNIEPSAGSYEVGNPKGI